MLSFHRVMNLAEVLTFQFLQMLQEAIEEKNLQQFNLKKMELLMS